MFLAKKNEDCVINISINKLTRVPNDSDRETLSGTHYDRSLGRINYVRENHRVVVLSAAD